MQYQHKLTRYRSDGHIFAIHRRYYYQQGKFLSTMLLVVTVLFSTNCNRTDMHFVA